ncbi:hypothetical protein [Qipengyuania sp. JC766]|uniref:hypothetical protein n=1 Tax=Qipengyuania sp. JC766 TaxID=3232139 RepID=UPI0034582699
MVRRAATILLMGATPLLGGCLAAAAIPVLAGGTIAGGDELVLGPRDGRVGEARDNGTAVPPPPFADETPQGSVREVAAVPAQGDVETADFSAGGSETRPADWATPQIQAPLPAPVMPGMQAGETAGIAAVDPDATISGETYQALYSYVEEQALRDPVDTARQSALLASPGSLKADRSDCAIRPPAFLVDLDPATGTFDADAPSMGDPSLVATLRAIRAEGVEVFWISSQSAASAGAIRRRLIDSGLDPLGRDPILLLRTPEERKQTRRRELGETHCVIAIAGDDRSDFDELYLYLRDRDAARPLDELVGAGWFLTPPPLQEGS